MRIPNPGRKAALCQAITLVLSAGSAPFALAQDTDDETSSNNEVVIVTGSRIVRRDFTAQTPIVTVEAETFTERANIGLEATLNQLPQFNVAGTQSESSSAGTAFPQATAAPGAATIDLRGLGLNRSLVLINGRRVQPVNGDLVVDLNTIPSAAIDRVEVITGGAAAVYGADAIAGVVNFIFKENFEGLEFSSQYGITERGDGQEISVNSIFGTDFADGEGNVMIGADYSRRDIIYGKDRDWVREGWNDPGTNAGGLGSSNLSQFAPDPANAPADGWLTSGTYYIDTNGALFDSNNPNDPAHPYTGPIGGDSGFRLNPDGSLGYNDKVHDYLQIPLERYSIFGNGHVNISDKIELFSEMRYSETFARSTGFISGLFNVWTVDVPYNPAYDDPDSPTFGMAPAGTAQHPVPAELADLLNSRPTPDAPWTYAGGMDYLPPWQTHTTSDVYQVIGGLRGENSVGTRDWYWSAYASHGKTTVSARQPEGFPYLPRVQNLFSADQYGLDFDLSSLPNYYPLAVTGHCTSGLPIFNPDGSVNNRTSVSQDCSDYITLRMNNITTLAQDVIEANVSGGLADLPAGELLFSLGVGTRKEHFSFDPDTGYNANQDFPNVVQNIILPVSVKGETNVDEIFGEMSIPLVAGRKFVQRFELDPGYRYSDYSSVGKQDTYKLLFDWTVNDHLRFRGGKQVATRAPNTAELFTPLGGSQLDFNAQDPCGYWDPGTQSWGNRPENPNRLNLQTLCQYLMVRDGAPPSLYEPGQPSANDWAWNVFGGMFNFPFSIAVTSGNPDLDSETADTLTFGTVLDFNRITVAVDWYKIDLQDAIGVPGFATVYQQCMDPAYNPLMSSPAGTYSGEELAAGSPFCELINREYVGGTPLTDGNFGAARNFNAAYINQGSILSKGYDVQLTWGTDLNGGGNLGLNFLASFLDSYGRRPFPGAEFVDYTGTEENASFDYQAFTTLSYSKGPWSLGLRWEHMPSLKIVEGTTSDRFGVQPHDNFDLYSQFTLGDRYTLRYGIDNLLDADPEIVGRTTTNNNLGSTNANYDQFGRRYYIGLNVSL